MGIHSEDVHALPAMIAGVRFSDVGKLYHFDCHHISDLLVGDFVIVETTRGRQMGQVMQKMAPDPDIQERDYKPILRKATPTDLMSQQLWKTKEIEALIICREKASELGGLDAAKFVSAQYNFDGTLLTIMFSADDKLNTGKLRTALQRSFKAKIELRQIGPRDVAKLLGGMGACGIPRCCSSFLTDFSPISIKMAKAQGISLNPSEITGMCGRLRCCLIYEYEQYVEARKILPKRNKRVGTPHGEGRVIDVHPLRDAVTVMVEDVRHVVMREDLIPLEEFEALKAKAEAGCAKHGDGPCDCGARSGKPDEELEDDEPIQAAPPAAVVEEDDDVDEVPGEIIEFDDKPQPSRKPQRKNRPRRGKSRRPPTK